jgi:predicted NACHT family NTPase
MDAPLTRAHVLEVMPFNFNQTTQFVHNWYLANKIISYGKNDPGVRQDAHLQATDLLTRMRAMPSFSALAVNPLLLTMVTMVHNYRGALPGRRVELYHEICDVLLGHWQKAKGIQDSLTALQKRSVLQPLAAYMMERWNSLEHQAIPTNETMGVINYHLREVGLEENQIQEFLKDLQECSGLFLEKEAGLWSFAHLTFQEYLCASHWRETNKTISWDRNEWLSFIKESWWHETLRLYAAMGDATPLVRACPDVDTIQSLTLAADIAEEALRLRKLERDKISSRLEQGLESDDPERARLAAHVLLNRRLTRRFFSYDDRLDIDTTLITCA